MVIVEVPAMLKTELEKFTLSKIAFADPTPAHDYQYKYATNAPEELKALVGDDFYERMKEPEFEQIIRTTWPMYNSFELILDRYDLADLMLEANDLGYKIEIRNQFEASVNLDNHESTNLLMMMDAATNLMQKQIAQLTSLGPQHYNEKCNAPVADGFLNQVDTVIIAEDLCTERLQDYLNSGWRILSICPQPNQRRPDYVLGQIKSIVVHKVVNVTKEFNDIPTIINNRS